MQLIQTLKLILSLLPLIIEAVRAIEAALPGSGQGAAKLELVRSTLEAGYQLATDAVIGFDAAWPAISKAVSAVVAFYNSTGAFRKS